MKLIEANAIEAWFAFRILPSAYGASPRGKVNTGTMNDNACAFARPVQGHLTLSIRITGHIPDHFPANQIGHCQYGLGEGPIGAPGETGPV